MANLYIGIQKDENEHPTSYFLTEVRVLCTLALRETTLATILAKVVNLKPGLQRTPTSIILETAEIPVVAL